MDLVSLMQFHQKNSVVPWSWSDCPLSQRVSFPPFLEYCTLPWAHLHSWSCFLNFTDNCSTRLCTAAAVTTFIMICSSGQKRLINVFQNSNWKWKQKELFYIIVGFFSCVFFSYQIVAFLLFILHLMQLFAWGCTEWMNMNETPGNAFLQGFYCSRYW